MSSKIEKRSALEKLEICVNTLNHTFIGIATFYTIWYCINYGFDKSHTLHVLLASLGYVLLMAEGIMSMYNGNTFTLFMTRSQKTNIHWILQATGGSLRLAAFFLEVVQRANAGKKVFHIWHARMGLVSAIFLCLSIFSGCSALFSNRFKNYLRPLFSKFFHNLFSICSFVFGFVAMIIAYNTRSWAKNYDPGNIRYVMIGILSSILLFTLIGPLKTFCRHVKITLSTTSEQKEEKNDEKI
ncbi:hypothetical protein PVAND_006645 [Polypedilum vanderplanki]|uniref:ascorbate ferrireductase (transmembrane) n=1 Tax=Polypedilum vanderplanki TaxID=319348 RepID=A0A9J6C5I2_POLVA|nr:hypothetical protein PVAND_006645 [Polypedilum vanderplanki]